MGSLPVARLQEAAGALCRHLRCARTRSDERGTREARRHGRPHPAGHAASRARVLFIVASLGALTVIIPKGQAQMTSQQVAPASQPQTHPYVGMWVTADERIRHNLLPNGRYDEARGHRESAYQGRYEVRGADIFYWDDTGFTADGRFVDGVLHHGGMILHRRSDCRAR